MNFDNDEYEGNEPDGGPAVVTFPAPPASISSRPHTPYLKLSPTQIQSALTCPAEYWYRYVERLESRRTPSFLAFGKAIHAAIEFAYGRRQTAPTPEDVAAVAEHHLRVADANGVAYKGDEALDDHVVMKKKSRKKDAVEEPVEVPGLVTQARALVALWWLQDRERVAALDDAVTEVSLTYALDGDTEFTCRVDAAERKDGQLWLGDHKTVKGWGDANARAASLSIQMYLECWLWWKINGERVDGFFFNVLKKTKEPEFLRWSLPAPTVDELVAFEDQLRAFAKIARHHKTLGRPVRAVQQKCGWCSFAPLCWNLEGARDMFMDRDERRKLEGKPADDVEEDVAGDDE